MERSMWQLKQKHFSQEFSPWNLCNSDLCYLAVSTQINIYCGDIFNIYIFVKITIIKDVIQLICCAAYFPEMLVKVYQFVWYGITSQKTVVFIVTTMAV
jgi:hypothetical protein